VVIEKVLPMSPVHLLPMSPVYTPVLSGAYGLRGRRSIFENGCCPLNVTVQVIRLRRGSEDRRHYDKRRSLTQPSAKPHRLTCFG
jgi:hypothetical protein